MRTARLIPWFLIASILISISALALANLLPEHLEEIGSYIALALLILVPGYLAVLFMFPVDDLDLGKRLLLSLAASAILAGFVSLILSLTPRGLEPASLATILALLTIFLAAISYLRWLAQPRNRRFIMGARRGSRFQRSSRRRSFAARNARVVIAITLVLTLSALFFALYSAGMNPFSYSFSSPEGSTELEVTWPDGLDGASSGSKYITLEAGRDLEARARIVNHEGSPLNYSLRLVFNNSTIFVKGVSLADNETWDSMLSFVLSEPAGTQRLELLLFKEGDSSVPYRSEQIMVNLIEGDSSAMQNLAGMQNSTAESNITSGSTPVILEETSKVTVLSAGGGASYQGRGAVIPSATASAPSSASAAASAPAAIPSQKSQPPSTQSTVKETSTKITDEGPKKAVEENAQKAAEMNAQKAAEEGAEKALDVPVEKITNETAEKTLEDAPSADAAIEAKKAEENITASSGKTRSGMKILAQSWENTSQDQSIPAKSELNTSSSLTAEIEVQSVATISSAPESELNRSQSISSPLAGANQTDIAPEEDAVSNQPPILQSLQPDRSSPQTKGTAIFWKAEAIDPDDDTIFYRFLLNGNEERKWSKSNSWSWPTQYLSPGTYTITVQARDGYHSPPELSDSSINATMDILEPNQVPILKELKASPQSPSPRGSKISWTATASDADGDEIFYRFLLNGSEIAGWSSSDSWVWDSSGSESGDYTITVQARDAGHGTQDSSDGQIQRSYSITEPPASSPEPTESPTGPPESSQPPPQPPAESSAASGAPTIVSSNQAPVLRELKSNASSPVFAGATINWTAKADDPDRDQISYKFLLDGKDVTGWSRSSSWNWQTAGAEPGDYRISVLARDGQHATADSYDSSLDASFTLQSENIPPVLVSLQPDQSSPQVQGTVINWKAEATDQDSDPILYKFQVDGKDMGRWSESSSWSWSTRGLAADSYRITVLARDGHHASEYSADSSLYQSFVINTEIDHQIDQLMSQRGFGTKGDSKYQSPDIKVNVAGDQV